MDQSAYKSFPRLTSEELILREVSREDIPELVDISFYDGKQAANISEALEMQAKIDRDYEKGESIHWVIESRTTGEIIGTCGYYRGFKNASGELGCILLPGFRGKGHITTAMRLAIGFGFRSIGLKRIFAATSKENFKAINLLDRLNFSRIAESGDEVEFEILRENLFSIRKYTPKDQKAVLQLLKLNTPENFHPSEEKDLEKYLEKEAQHYFVAEGVGSILAAGGFNMGFDSGKTARISWDMVDPAFQGLGIGKRLLLFRLREINKDPLVLRIVVRTTPQAEKFYQNMGFQKGQFKKDFWAPGFDLCEMEMNI